MTQQELWMHRNEENVQKDKSEKILEDYNDVFADIYNVLVFDKKYLDENGLEAGPTESIYKAEEGDLKEQRRDVLKTYRKQNFVICSLGIENQSAIDKYMPLRVMGYDYATYRSQLSNKKELIPTITIVLNFSDEEWNEATNLRALFDVRDELKEFVPDYCIKVFNIAFLEDDVIEKFTSDFRLVAKFFKKRRLGELDVISDNQQEIKHIEAVLEMFRVFTQDERYEADLVEKMIHVKRRGDEVHMCIIAETLEQRGIKKGISQGRFEQLIECVEHLMDSQKCSLEKACEMLGTTIQTYQEAKNI